MNSRSITPARSSTNFHCDAHHRCMRPARDAFLRLPLLAFVLALLALVLALLLPAEMSAQRTGGSQTPIASEPDRLTLRARALGRGAGILADTSSLADPAQRAALRQLHLALPLGDLLENAIDLRESVRLAFAARERYPWGVRVPDELFRAFVVPPRVNNELLDTARSVFHRAFADRLRGLTMREAALEINRWCHERVTYRSTDARTSSPLAAILAGFGRCGEESTLLTAALRAACIPARQCYTPRWAHQDDNHAWVEAWVDGGWHFMGACEPEPDLDLAWFAAPATRAMLVATTAAGAYEGPEPVLTANGWSTRINLLSNYAPVRECAVVVTDAAGRRVKDATVDFRLYNYAELFPLTSARTDALGRARFTTGLGDLVVWARGDGRVAFRAVSVGSADTVRLTLASRDPGDGPFTFDLTPPVERPPAHTFTGDRTEHERRNRRGDSMRAAYTATFIDSAAWSEIARGWMFNADSSWASVHAAGGNWRAIRDLLGRTHEVSEGAASAASLRALCLAFLTTLAAKDLRDASDDALHHFDDCIAATPPRGDQDAALYRAFVLSPRIGLEPLVRWRGEIRTAFGVPPLAPSARAFRAQDVIAWVRDSIAIDSLQNWARVPVSPRAVVRTRVADPVSRDIFFVAACRSLGIPARLDAATSRPEVWDQQRWMRPLLDPLPAGVGGTAARATGTRGAKRSAPARIGRGTARGTSARITGTSARFTGTSARITGTLALLPPANTGAIDPEYSLHYTIARLDQGQLRLLDYEGAEQLAHLPAQVTLDTGRYALTTGVRQGDGSVRVRLEFFTIRRNATTERTLVLRDEPLPLTVLERLDPALLDVGTEEVTAGGTMLQSRRRIGADGRSAILLWMRANHEPSRHVAVDMDKLRASFERAGTEVYVFDGGSGASGSASELAPMLPAQSVFGSAPAALRARIEAHASDAAPLVAYVRPDGDLVFASAGYRIGLGEQLLKIIARDAAQGR